MNSVRNKESEDYVREAIWALENLERVYLVLPSNIETVIEELYKKLTEIMDDPDGLKEI